MKKLTTSLVLVVFLASVWVPAAFAAGAPTPATVVGSYTVADLGQGGWAGGALRSDNTISGGGSYAASTPEGQVIAKITGGSWSGTLATGHTVTLCLDVLQIYGPAETVSSEFCAPITVNAGPTVIDGALFRVTTTHGSGDRAERKASPHIAAEPGGAGRRASRTSPLSVPCCCVTSKSLVGDSMANSMRRSAMVQRARRKHPAMAIPQC